MIKWGGILKYLLIDERMRDVEKQTLKNLGYELIEIKKSINVYPEISSHVDIFACKVKDKIIVEKLAYKMLKNKLNNDENILISGEKMISYDYPNDIKYNVCIVGNKAIHNFKYTDSKIISELNKNNFELINVKQGYSNCSISVIDEKSIILSDRGLYNNLKNSGLDILFLDYIPSIKLFDENGEYSQKNGFIGGAISRIGDNIVVFGDIDKIDYYCNIRKFIESRNLKIIDFEGLDVIDYGGVIEQKLGRNVNLESN